MVLVVERLQECGGCGENSQLGRIRSSAVDYVSSNRSQASKQFPDPDAFHIAKRRKLPRPRYQLHVPTLCISVTVSQLMGSHNIN